MGGKIMNSDGCDVFDVQLRKQLYEMGLKEKIGNVQILKN